MRNSIDDDSITESEDSEQYTPRRRVQRREITKSTRRRSTLLYLEKYGLDQPNWYANDEGQSSEEITTSPIDTPEDLFLPDPLPLPQSPTRPASILNSRPTSLHQTRPAHFIKPERPLTNPTSLPAEFRPIQDLIDHYHTKLYLEGYLLKRNDRNTNGTHCQPNDWEPYYVDLTGPILTLWRDQPGQNTILPQYINITDATVSLDSRPGSFALNSAGANRYLFQTPLFSDWILAIRLSCFEGARLQERYTLSFLSRQPSIRTRKAGYVQVRFPGTTGWQRTWAVLDRHLMFFQTKRDKVPSLTIDCLQAYVVYPESPQLSPTLFKLEGQAEAALVMTSDPTELVSWLLSIYDTFGLYGRPHGLLHDPGNPQALNFGQPRGPQLYLDLQEVLGQVEVGSGLASTKRVLNEILLEKQGGDLSSLSSAGSFGERRTFYAQQSVSMNHVSSPEHHPWPMYNSSSSIHIGPPKLPTHWETYEVVPSVKPKSSGFFSRISGRFSSDRKSKQQNIKVDRTKSTPLQLDDSKLISPSPSYSRKSIFSVSHLNLHRK